MMCKFGFIFFLFLFIFETQAFAKKCNYRFSGRVRVDHHGFMSNLVGQSESNLKKVKVRISARAKVGFGWGWWKPWAELTTDEKGRFSFSRRLNCKRRRFMVKTKFQNDRLEVRHEKSTQGTTKVKWYTVYKETSGNSGKNDYSEFFDITFGQGGREQDDREPHHHAEIWSLYWRVIDHFDNDYSNSKFRFKKKIKVKYPHDKKYLSYANPLNGVIYLTRNDDNDAGQDVDTMIHELMHIWAYQHSQNEHRMAEYLVWHQNRGTHGVVDKSYVAFHEGFAEFAKDKVMETLFGRGNPAIPSNNWLVNEGFDTFHRIEFSDVGWIKIFRLLNHQNLQEFNYGTSDDALSRTTPPGAPNYLCEALGHMSFKDLLEVMEFGRGSQFHVQEMNFTDFMRTLQQRESDFKWKHRETYRRLVTPGQSYQEIMESFCTRPLVIDPPVFNPLPSF